MNVKEIMHNITKLDADTLISEAAKIMDRKSIGSVLVEENNKVVGIMTERDILRKIVAKGIDPNKTTVREIMNSPLITADADTSIEEASDIMAKHGIRRLVVTEDNKIAGIITVRAIAENVRYSIGKRILEDKESEHYRPSYGKPEE